MAKSYKRRQKFVDRQVQGSIVLRTTTYWVLCMFTLSLMLFVWQILTSPAEPFLLHLKSMWHQYGPVAIASMLILPILTDQTTFLEHTMMISVCNPQRAAGHLPVGQTICPIRPASM